MGDDMDDIHNVEITDTSAEPLYLECEDDIPRISYLPYEEFFGTYLLKNRPCIFKEFISKDWESRKTWSNGNIPNWQFIRNMFGDAKVPVANCGTKEYNSQKKDTYFVRDYLDYLEQYIKDGHPLTKPILYLKFLNRVKTYNGCMSLAMLCLCLTQELKDSRLHVVSHWSLPPQDWHFTRDFPQASSYRVPKYFASDWLNEYFSARTDLHDDYRFVYIGPKGSWTPLHADVFTSYSWSINVVGRKRWLLFPPGQEVNLKDQLGNLVYDITEEGKIDGNNFTYNDSVGKCFDIIQETGEAIFVPSGWHHQVWNLEDTISINHNWVNGCSIRHMWFALHSCLSAVQREVSDCCDMDDWDSHCQIMLRATHGLNYEEFFDMLQCIAEPRIMQVNGQQKVKMYGDWYLGQKHAVWDLNQILNTLNLMLSDPILSSLKWVLDKKPIEFRNKIENVVQTLGLKENAK